MTLVRARDITHTYRGTDVPALADVALSLSQGTTALVGINGAGKSTLMSVLSGGLRPDRGHVTIDGDDLYGRGHRSALRGMALMPQSLALPKHLTALEAVELLAWLRGLSSARTKDAARAALEAVALDARGGTKVGNLSGGMRRRLALAQALVAQPEVLFLDEPSTGLDPQQRRLMIELVKGLSGVVLFSSHVMEDVVDVARDIIVLHQGRVVYQGDLAGLVSRHAGADQVVDARSAEAAFLHLITDAARL